MTYLIPVGIPDEETRKMLWRKSFPKEAPLSSDVDFDVLARAVEISGSCIKSSAIAAAYIAASEGRNITMNDIAEAADLECKKTGQMGVGNDILQMMYSG
jgi:SpoVK/Ycf46/Vps4 family AAA+-type ATPase